MSSRDKELHCHCVSPKLQTVTIAGIPFLMCLKCGKALPKPVVDKTYTKRELQERYRPKPQSRTFDLERLIIETFEEQQRKKKK